MSVRNEEDVLVSIVMASYNHEYYIREAIQSVINQTYQNWELIIIDDGSIDKTRNVIESFLDDGRIKFFAQENHGVAYTTNRCIEKTKGDVICFLDSDDLYMSEKLKNQVELYKKGYGIISTKVDVVDGAGKVLKNNCRSRKFNDFDEEILAQKGIADMLKRSYFVKSSVMIDKDLFDEVGLFDERLVGSYDWHMWLRIMPLAKIVRCDYHGTQYRWHGKNEMITNNNRINIEIALICEWYWQNAISSGKNIVFEDYFNSISDYITKEYFSIIQFMINLYSKTIDINQDPFVLLEDENFLINTDKYINKKKNIECQKLQKKIDNMEQSSFWKMRDKYLKLKKVLKF